tara:strand:- start:107 stop:817 length:711 start_codon:yes stop_codon:yes gene_type:complete
MSHRFPKFPLLPTSVPDLDDVNANFYETAEEVNGLLNEHNWDESATNGIGIGDLATDLFVWHSAGVYEPIDLNTSGPASNLFTPKEGFNWYKIPQDPQWRTVDSMTTTFTATGGLLWILASWQMRPNYQMPAVTRPGPAFDDLGSDDRVDETPCPSVALRINGSVLVESTLGSLDSNNYAAPGLAYGVWPGSTSLVIAVPSGPQTVDVVVRTGASHVDASPAWIGSRELIVLEMRR